MGKRGGAMKKRKKKETHKDDYELIIHEIHLNPFRMLHSAFALMAIIPILVIFYIVIGKKFAYDFFLGNDGIVAGIAIVISLIGLL